MRAVICEDESELRWMLEVMLQRRAYEVFTYPDPLHCPLSSIARCPCPAGTVCADAILTDVQMPGGNGIDFVETLIAKGCKCRNFCIMSGSWTEEERVRAVSLGCVLLEKPFRIHQVFAWLQEVGNTIDPVRCFFDFDWKPLE
jgi:DNA-binding response OmpR family regulator